MPVLLSPLKSPFLWLVAIMGCGLSVGAFFLVQDWENKQAQMNGNQAFKAADDPWEMKCFRSSSPSFPKLPWGALAGGLLLTAFMMGYLIQRNLAEDRLRSSELKCRAVANKLQSLALQLSAAEDQERRRIATHLHDLVSQGLAAAMMRLTLYRRLSMGQERVKEMDEIEKLLGQSLDNCRSLTSELSSPVLHDLGLEPAIEWAAEQIHKRFGLETRVEWDGRPRALNEQIRNVLFHATCELLTNVAKHAKTRNATVSIESNGQKIRISVKDRGVGFDGSKFEYHETGDEFGLFNIRERLEHLGGCLVMDAALGRGVTATLIAPLKSNEDFEI